MQLATDKRALRCACGLARGSCWSGGGCAIDCGMMNLGPWWKGVLQFRCGHLQEVACPIDCMQVTVKSNTPGEQGRCEDLCSACEALALLRRLPKRFEFNGIRHRCGHGIEGARRYADGDASDAEAEVEMGADDEMSELLDDVADSRCSTCLESAGFEPPSIEL